MIQNIDKTHLYDDGETYFLMNRSPVMFLTPSAAIAVCNMALQQGFLVGKIEGGIFNKPRFEARLDCIWDGLSPPVSMAQAEENNLKARRFIEMEAERHNAFVITTLPLTKQAK